MVHYYYHFMAVCPGLPGWAGTRRNTHPLTPIVIISHPLSASPSTTIHSIASSLFNLLAWHSFFTASLQVLFGVPLDLAPFTSYSIHFFTQSLSSFRYTCPYQCSLFCCSTKIMSSNPSFFFCQLFSWNSVYFLNATHISDHCTSICYIHLNCIRIICWYSVRLNILTIFVEKSFNQTWPGCLTVSHNRPGFIRLFDYT